MPGRPHFVRPAFHLRTEVCPGNPSGEMTMRKRKRDKKIAEKLFPIGYRPIGSALYILDSPNDDVQNILVFSMSMKGASVIFCEFSFRNVMAEEFGLSCIQKYGDEMYKYLEKRDGLFLHLRISLGVMADWQPRGGLYAGDEEIDESLEIISGDISKIVVPIASKIKTIEELNWLLLSNGDLAPWFRTNAAIRAANSIFLMTGMGCDKIKIREEISPYFRFIERSRLKIDPIDYVDTVIEEAESFMSLR